MQVDRLMDSVLEIWVSPRMWDAPSLLENEFVLIFLEIETCENPEVPATKLSFSFVCPNESIEG